VNRAGSPSPKVLGTVGGETDVGNLIAGNSGFAVYAWTIPGPVRAYLQHPALVVQSSGATDRDYVYFVISKTEPFLRVVNG